ncbi:hypothetical protein PVAND_003066 [Polypedilum vanderplanki]|uniref:Hflx-type G domain-containing protein n=1 Tax=Polypedilum vanderplanki TaxID=319348 RepID=A0A9J6BUK9_POLVA|nr:hypothetical protein PVAND_003066 [Polypedilum vanderplanki]
MFISTIRSISRLTKFHLSQYEANSKISLLSSSAITIGKRFKHVGSQSPRSGKRESGNTHHGKFEVDSVSTEQHDIIAESDESISLLDDKEYDTIVNTTMHVVNKKLLNLHNVMVLQPYIKWGPNKVKNIKPENQLAEAESLVRTLNWSVVVSLKVSLENTDRKMVFGSGKLDELKQIVNKCNSEGQPISCIFISKGTLKFVQKLSLSKFFGIPVMDRYSVVIQILRLHAITTEARLQVALAEIPYIRSQMREIETQGNIGQNLYLTDTQKMMLKKREKRLQQELEKLRTHRELLRNKRKQKQFPVVAVVGYTNCGKTSLIKALTNETSLQPRNQLFATLDVTAHAGMLPCRLEVLFMDTVGFMSDIPTGLIECFVATLEDALDADIIVHVQDISHDDWILQRNHVEKTLITLMRHTSSNNSINGNKKIDEKVSLDNVINVGNKIDLVSYEKTENIKDLRVVSSKTLAGINDLLIELEEKILQATDRVKMTIRVPMGGEEMQWLYKNTAVTSSEADPNNNQKILLNCVISRTTLEIFKHRFIG